MPTSYDVDIADRFTRQIRPADILVQFFLQLLFPPGWSTQPIDADLIHPSSFHLFHAPTHEHRHITSRLLLVNQRLKIGAKNAVRMHRRSSSKEHVDLSINKFHVENPFRI